VNTSLASITSPPRDDIVTRALIDGTTSEMLFKELGRVSFDPDRAGGSFAVLVALEALGLDLGVPVDGSGLSDANLTTCNTIISLIEHPEIGPRLQAALPDAPDTALAECAPATGMKLLTATEENTAAIAGVYSADNGDVITFTMIANSPDLAALLLAPCNPLSATLLDAVAGHPYGTDLTEILPLPATS
jgi:D-alanyl-D-alanine carboxypeptidase